MRCRGRLVATALAVAAFTTAVGSCGSGGEGAAIVTGPPGTGTFTPSGSAPPADGPDPTAAPVTTTAMRRASGTISTAGLDRVTFGMTPEEAGRSLGVELTGDRRDAACFTASGATGPDGVTFVVADGKVERVDVRNPGIATRSGARVGSTATDIRALYGSQIQEQPRTDGQPGTALVYVPRDAGDAQYRLVFLTDGSVVTEIRAGRLPVVLAGTGCR